MAKRKRAPGGGRKRLGPSVAQNLTIRIDNNLRGQLEAAAAKRAERNRGWNLSQELLLRLRWTLSKEHERERDVAMRALSFLISEAAGYLNLGLSPNWNRDPFLFGAFRVAVSKILEALQPPGEAQPPPPPAGTDIPLIPFKTPEAAGEMAASVTLSQLQYPRSESEQLAYVRVLENMPVSEHEHVNSFQDQVLEQVRRDYYTISRARRDLGIEGRVAGIEGIKRAWEDARETNEPKGDNS